MTNTIRADGHVLVDGVPYESVISRWGPAPYEPVMCKTCFHFEDRGVFSNIIVHEWATGYYQEPDDEQGRAMRQGVCNRSGCRSRRYAAELGASIVEYSMAA